MKDPEMHDRDREDGEAPILRICGASKAFGGVQALEDVSFEVSQGMILGMIGPNGAGKTTLFNLISGLYPPDAGRIFFNEAEIQRLPTHQRVRMGIARTFQNLALFENMNVLENVMVGQHVRTRCGFWERSPEPRECGGRRPPAGKAPWPSWIWSALRTRP